MLLLSRETSSSIVAAMLTRVCRERSFLWEREEVGGSLFFTADSQRVELLFSRRRSPCSTTIRDMPLAWYLITAKFIPSSCQVPNSNLAAKFQLGKNLPSSYLAAKFFWLGTLSTSSTCSDCQVWTWLPSFELGCQVGTWQWFAKLKKHEKAGRH